MTVATISPYPDGSLTFFYAVILMNYNNNVWTMSDVALTNCVSLQYSQDISQPTGTGQVTIPFRSDYNNVIAVGDRIQIRGNYFKSPAGVDYHNLPLIVDGIVKNVKPERTTIDILFSDWGVQLEGHAVQTMNKWGNFTGKFVDWKAEDAITDVIGWAGLNPILNWGDNPNPDVNLDYTNLNAGTATAKGGTGLNPYQTANPNGYSPIMGNPPATGSCITGSGPPANQCAGVFPYQNYDFSWLNWCPLCNTPTMIFNGIGMHCTLCTSDFDPVTGFDTGCINGVANAPTGSCTPECKVRLTPCPGTGTASTNANLTSTSNTITSGFSSAVTAIMKEASRFSYCTACQSGDCIEADGCGSCWAMSDYLYSKFTAAGFACRIIQYDLSSYGYASNHRTVQLKDNNGNWIDPEYLANGLDILFNAYPSTNPKPSQFTIEENTATGIASSGSTNSSSAQTGISLSTVISAITGNTNSASTTWWDIVMDIIEASSGELDLEVYVFGTDCFVIQPPNPDDATIMIDDTVNLVAGSVRRNEADPNAVNTVIVSYGKTKVPETVTKVSTKGKTTTKTKFVTVDLNEQATATNEALLDINNNPIVVKYDKPNMSSTEAEAYANRMLRKLEKNASFSIDCSVIGHPAYSPGHWCVFQHSTMDINDTYFITKTNFKVDKWKAPITDITVMDYLPSYSGGGGGSSSNSSSSSDVQPTLDKIGQEEAQFQDVQGVCSDVNCFESLGYGDCWADSEWLYKQLSAANIKCRIMGYQNRSGDRHAWIQIDIGNGWTDWNYSSYNSYHIGDFAAGSDTPILLIDNGATDYSITNLGWY